MQHLDLTQLAGWLSSSGIERLELTSPQGHIHLRRSAVQQPMPPTPAPTPTSCTPSAAAADAGGTAVAATAHNVGIFLSHHPSRTAPLVLPGQAVTTGQCIGLLRVGSLLLPIAAPADGVAGTYLVEAGQAIGYGTPVLHIHPR